MKLIATVALVFMTLLLARTGAEEILYLHCFQPTYGHKIDPKPGEEPATPPARLIPLRVTPGSDFEAMWGVRGHAIAGRVSRNKDSLDITLQGNCGSGFAFNGKVEVEKVFDPGLTWFSGVVFPCRCVLSKHKEIEPFLQAQAATDAKKLEEATASSHQNQRKAAETKGSQTEGTPPP
jgi:hypothetical protein